MLYILTRQFQWEMYQTETMKISHNLRLDVDYGADGGAGWKFPTAWSKKPNHLRIVTGKYFKTILHFKIFQTKISVYVTMVVKSHTGLCLAK